MQHFARFRPLTRCEAVEAILDASTGLTWEALPQPTAVSWEQASPAVGSGWRLPTAAELMCFLTTLPETHPFPRFEPGSIYWSSSQSPFAPASRVRGVVCEGGGRFATLLLEKEGRARRWLVRESTLEASDAG